MKKLIAISLLVVSGATQAAQWNCKFSERTSEGTVGFMGSGATQEKASKDAIAECNHANTLFEHKPYVCNPNDVVMSCTIVND